MATARRSVGSWRRFRNRWEGLVGRVWRRRAQARERGMSGAAVAIVRGRAAEARTERAVERADGAEPDVEGDRQDGQMHLRAQARACFIQAIAVQELVEIAIAEALVDRTAHQVFLRAESLGQAGD